MGLGLAVVEVATGELQLSESLSDGAGPVTWGSSGRWVFTLPYSGGGPATDISAYEVGQRVGLPMRLPPGPGAEIVVAL